jgi:hypothetical protein
MSKKKYVLEEIRAIQQKVKDSNEDYTSHMVIGVDMDENGYPESTMTMSSAKPTELIGMCDQIIAVLKQIKKDTIKKLMPPTRKEQSKRDFVNSPDFEKMTSALPKPIADKIRDFKRRMDAAIESGDAEEMKKIKDELIAMKDPFKQMNEDLDELKGFKKDDDFNINDFK